MSMIWSQRITECTIVAISFLLYCQKMQKGGGHPSRGGGRVPFSCLRTSKNILFNVTVTIKEMSLFKNAYLCEGNLIFFNLFLSRLQLPSALFMLLLLPIIPPIDSLYKILVRSARGWIDGSHFESKTTHDDMTPSLLQTEQFICTCMDLYGCTTLFLTRSLPPPGWCRDDAM